MNDALQRVVEQELATLGYELVEFRRRGSRSRPVLDLRVERTGAEGTATGMTIDDCARVSRALEARFEDGGLVAERYVLEVSTPGIERPLRRPADWRRFAGQRAVIAAPSLPGGRAEVTVIALDGVPGAEVVVVRDARGAEYRVPLADVADARLAFHWNSGKE